MRCLTSSLRTVAPLACVRLAACAVMLVLGATAPLFAQVNAGSDEDRRAMRMTPIARVFREASPAVVNLSTTRVVTVERRLGGIFDEIFDFPNLRSPMKYKTQSVGSGFLIHGEGYIVTNAHVVDRASECKAIFSDGTELDAEQIAIDREYDIAVLKVKAPRPLPFLRLGRSDDLIIGETVIAIGNPLGYQHTVTSGVISAINRELNLGQNHVYPGLIQTDASINFGNSGGPLLNVLGELIGINTAIRGDAQNIGFAIPVDRLHAALPVMLDIERLRRVDFGAHFTSANGTARPRGVPIGRVDADSPAAEAGVSPGDVLIAIDNQPTREFIDAFTLLERTPPGQSMKLDLIDSSGQRRTREVVLADIPRLDPSQQMQKFFGLEVRELTQGDLNRLGLQSEIGLMVTSVKPGSEADRQELAPGDLMTMFGGYPVKTLALLGQLVEQVNHGDRIPFQLIRIRNDTMYRFDLALTAR